MSANVSYEQAERDVDYLTGIRIPAKTQQRLVHRQTFLLPTVAEPLQELCVDGGKVRRCVRRLSNLVNGETTKPSPPTKG